VPIVVANIKAASTGGNPASQQILSRLRPYLLRDVDGVKVGIIGLDTPGVPHWSRPRLIAGLEFVDSVETLRKIVPEALAAGAQVLVLVAIRAIGKRAMIMRTRSMRSRGISRSWM